LPFVPRIPLETARRLPRAALVCGCSCLLAAGLLGCGITTGEDQNHCPADFRPATLVISGVAGTVYACGLVSPTSSSSFTAVSFFDGSISNNASVTFRVAAAPGSYPVNAANAGKI